jgi:uncharacterized protein (DUF2141 family)
MKLAGVVVSAAVIAMALAPTALFAWHQSTSVSISTTGAAEISGRVVSSDLAPTPVRRATLTLRDGARLLLVAVTDDSGAFAFVNLPAGEFTLSATKGGYLPAQYGARLPGGVAKPIVLSAAQRASAVTVYMQKGSVITGVVTDEEGQPVPDVRMQAFKRAISDLTGGPALLAAPFAVSQVTDDRGRYRIWGLEAGEYAVSAASPLRQDQAGLLDGGLDIRTVTDADVQRARRSLADSAARPGASSSAANPPAPAARVTYAPVFFPSTAAPAEASLIRLGPQEERDNVNIQLRMVPTANVYGTVTGEDGVPIATADIVMLDPGPLPAGTIARSYRNGFSGPDGKYLLAGIAPGTYEIMTTTHGSSAPLFAVTEVTVSGRDTELSIVMRPGLTVSGRLVFEGMSPPPREMTALLPWITPVRYVPNVGTSPPKVEADGAFTLTLMRGEYRVGAGFAGPPKPIGGWILKSLVINGTRVEDITFDVTDNISGVVATFTDQPTEISGVIQDAAGQPTSDFVLLAFSADKRFRLPQSRRTQLARPDGNGRFVIRNLPAGDYLIVALTDVDPNQLVDPAFFAELESHAPAQDHIGRR